MYLIYDNVTGEALKAFNIPVEGNYIEISPEQWTEICENNEKYFVSEGKLSTTETENYKAKIRLTEIEKELEQTDIEYKNALETPVQYLGSYFKPVWIDDGTYVKLIVGVQQGIVKFPKDIWDVTKKKENMIPMTQEQFYGLIAILEQAQSKAFDVRKNKQSDLINEKEALLKQLEN